MGVVGAIRRHWTWCLAGLVMAVIAVGIIYLNQVPDDAQPRQAIPTFSRPSLDGLEGKAATDELARAFGVGGGISLAGFVPGDPRQGYRPGDALKVSMSLSSVGPMLDYGYWINNSHDATKGKGGGTSATVSGIAYGINPTAMIVLFIHPSTSRASCSITINGETVASASENRAWHWLVCAA